MRLPRSGPRSRSGSNSNTSSHPIHLAFTFVLQLQQVFTRNATSILLNLFFNSTLADTCRNFTAFFLVVRPDVFGSKSRCGEWAVLVGNIFTMATRKNNSQLRMGFVDTHSIERSFTLSSSFSEIDTFIRILFETLFLVVEYNFVGACPSSTTESTTSSATLLKA